MTLLRKGDPVIVIAGQNRAKKKNEPAKAQEKREIKEDRGKVLEVFPGENKVIVEHIKLVTKHKRMRMSEKGQEGGRVRMEAKIDASNVMYQDPKTNKPVRLGITTDAEGNKHRITRGRNSSGTIIE